MRRLKRPLNRLPGMPSKISGPKRRTECSATAVPLPVSSTITQISAVTWNQEPSWDRPCPTTYSRKLRLCSDRVVPVWTGEPSGPAIG